MNVPVDTPSRLEKISLILALVSAIVLSIAAVVESSWVLAIAAIILVLFVAGLGNTYRRSSQSAKIAGSLSPDDIRSITGDETDRVLQIRALRRRYPALTLSHAVFLVDNLP
ncbi:hypothetical protein IEU95_14675 [Hoyosella rhizosphaerae]|uniref:Uncharacterized protein n=1 Tax=Hoyosella rhizosphaerae TaxID=1755582 RepID=A0A916XGT2_9ACTN|nr:hypothetical protein [Hoyosella rhizosphaerae]MBN4928083.1 hypothetical protein [Hoyosella rhizosphaerae]GGC72277.1 hypothetical protein GCM10011410_26620 [Hoyosella rhizosphaerae]